MKILPINNDKINNSYSYNYNKKDLHYSVNLQNISFDGFQKDITVRHYSEYVNLINKINSSIVSTPINVEAPFRISTPNIKNIIKNIKTEFQHWRNYEPSAEDSYTFTDKAKHSGTRIVYKNSDGSANYFKKIDKNNSEELFLSFDEGEKPYHLHLNNDSEKYIFLNDEMLFYIKKDKNKEITYHRLSKDKANMYLYSYTEFDSKNQKIKHVSFNEDKKINDISYFIDNKICKVTECKDFRMFWEPKEIDYYFDKNNIKFRQYNNNQIKIEEPFKALVTKDMENYL